MAFIVFPENPFNGQVYPPIAVPGVQQYVWDEATSTWKIYDPDFIEKSIIDDKGDLIVGKSSGVPDVLSLGEEGQVLTVDSGETLGLKWGTLPAPGAIISTVNFSTGSLAPGASQDFSLNLGSFFTILSVSVSSSSSAEDAWIRMYLTASGGSSDTRTVPGPPFPSVDSGFALEIVTTSAKPLVTLIPSLSFYTETGPFFRIANQSQTTQTFTLTLKISS